MVQLTLVGMFGLGMLGSCIQSVLAPFFPHEARKKGINDSTIGLIFGIQPIIASICSPIIGMILAKAGRKRVLLLSAFMLGLSSFSFALIPNLEKAAFIAIGFLSRAFQGVGAAGLTIAVVAIISIEYRDNIEKMFGIQQTLSGMAMIIGPVIGLILFKLGGFSCIFYVLSVVFFAGLVFLIVVLPKDKPDLITKENVSWKILMSVKTVPLNCLLVACAFGSLGSLEPLLGNFLDKEFGIDPSMTALVFIIPTIAYPLTVFISNKFFSHVAYKTKMSFGLFLIGASLIIVGPAGFTGVPSSLFGTLFGVFGVGVGMALSMVPALPDMVNSATEELAHIEASLISDRVSSLINFSMFVGKGVFAPFAGFLCDKVEFKSTMAIIGGIIILYLLIFKLVTRPKYSIAGLNSSTGKRLLTENELKETKKSFYLLEEDEV